MFDIDKPPFTTDVPGVFDIENAEYHACHWALSSSGARAIVDSCPAKFKAQLDTPREPKKVSNALDLGSASHAMLLEPEKWDSKFTVLPEDHSNRTNVGKALVEDIRANGRTPVEFDDFQTIKAMHAAMMAHPFAAKLFMNGQAEKSLFWKDEQTGVWCRNRPDWLVTGGNIIPDYKTTISSDPRELNKALWNYGYYQQAAWYQDGVRALGLVERPTFVLVFQEKEAPYLVTVAKVSPSSLEWGRIRNRRAIEIFAQCRETGVWPGYASDVVTLDIPAWAEKELERERSSYFTDQSQAA